MHDEPTFGSQVRQGPPPRTSRGVWPRLLVFAFLAVLMLVAFGGTSRASELDPNETVNDALDPVVEAVTDTVDPVVEGVTDTVDPIVGSVTDAIDPVIGTVTDTIDPVVDTVITPDEGHHRDRGCRTPSNRSHGSLRRARAFPILDRSAVSPMARATTV